MIVPRTWEKTYATLTEKLLRRMPAPGNHPTLVPGFVMKRRDEINKPENCWNRPILAATAQGAERVVVGRGSLIQFNREYKRRSVMLRKGTLPNCKPPSDLGAAY